VSTRNPAARGPADRNHRAIREAIELLGYPVMDLSAAGNGVEDLLVGMLTHLGGATIRSWWLLVECKVPRNKRGAVTESQLTTAQKQWRERSQGWPRITVVSAQDAVEQLRRMTCAE